MKLNRILRLSFNMLVHSKLRSWLTVIGIVIGVAAVVAIVSIGQGLQQNVQSQLGGLGQDIITINAGSGRALTGGGAGSESVSTSTNTKKLSDKDIQTLKLVPGIKYIDGIVSGRADVVYNSETASISIQGLDPGTFKEFVSTSLATGRYFSQGETGSIIIGSRIANSVFKSTIKVGYTLKISGHPYKVIGILSSSSGFGSTDNAIYTSSKDARDMLQSTLNLNSNEYSSIQVKVTDPNVIENTTAKIDTALTNARHTRADKKDFSVTSPLALQQRFTSLTSSITLFLGLIAAVSLIVGGIGVANTMFTSVLEKTKDIGIMKAVGAKNKDILLIFLLNSGMLGLVGGLIGVFFGALISYLLPILGASLSLPGGRGGLLTSISPSLLIFTLLFSLVIGMISGAIPAYRASKLKPVDALRYE